jgi:hypothetical protein
MKALRIVWIGIGVLALGVSLRALELSQRAGSPRATWTNLLAVAFAVAILASAFLSARSQAARKVFAICLVVCALYCAAFVMLVGLEFGAVWLATVISVGALAVISIWLVLRKPTSANVKVL